ncbi:MAG TPA: hypothetical protein VFU32_15280, partial [Ktedonobacterales bacterium]|nr:hypothetical protein [Ktedonobacterales bacterium]
MLLSIRKFVASPWGILSLALCARLVVLLSTTGVEYDITSYHLQALSVLLHRNVYLFTGRYPYPPVWIWLVTLAQVGANATSLPFVWLVKIPGLLGDCLIILLLQRYVSREAARFYALNPIAILVTAGHGQFDGFVIGLAMLSWVFLRKARHADVHVAALTLGGAIALKGYPVLLFPALLKTISQKKQRWLAIVLALLPLVIACLIYSALFGFVKEMITSVLTHGSPTDFGWSLLTTSLLKFFVPSRVTQVMDLLGIITRAIIVLLACVFPWRWRSWPVERLWLVTLFSFYFLSPGVSVQYLIWVLPLFAVVDRKLGWVFTVFSTLVALMFYLTVFPGAVPGGTIVSSLAPRYIWQTWYLATDFVWWLICWHIFFK